MIDLKNLRIEHKAGAIFAAAALTTSLLAGVVSGTGFVVILVRLFILTPIFAAIGFTSIFIIKKYVPELYDTLSGKSVENKESTQENRTKINSDEDDIQDGIESSDSQETSTDEVIQNAADGDDSDEELEKEFKELTKEDLPKLDSSEAGDIDISSADSKMGKHIISKEQDFKYEPEVMAKAIRTMMSKDEE